MHLFVASMCRRLRFLAHVHPFGRAGPARRRAHRRDSKPFEPRGGAGALDPADVRQHRPGPAGGRRLAVRRDESTVSNDQCSAVLVGVFLLNAPLNGHVPLLPPPPPQPTVHYSHLCPPLPTDLPFSVPINRKNVSISRAHFKDSTNHGV